jgi:hypothetical protein
MAQQLKDAGLEWEPAVNDFFAVPDRGFDDKVFVISDVFANVEPLRGAPAVTFHGAVEWALDHVMVGEVVWLPTEGQLRDELERRLAARGPWEVHVTGSPDGYVCEMRAADRALRFEARRADAAYAAALLHLLNEAKGEEVTP